jgi:hypothetical protein
LTLKVNVPKDLKIINKRKPWVFSAQDPVGKMSR